MGEAVDGVGCLCHGFDWFGSLRPYSLDPAATSYLGDQK